MLGLLKKNRVVSSDMQVLCNVCLGKAVISSRNQQSDTVADLYCSCRDPMCGHTFVMTLAFKHTLSPSAKDTKKLLVDLLASMPRHEQMQLLENVQRH
jgi:hypothetical protein